MEGHQAERFSVDSTPAYNHIADAYSSLICLDCRP